jgi:hypothetical protein
MKSRFRCFILLDTLISLFLAGLILVVVFVSVSLGLKHTSGMNRHSRNLILLMNRYEEEKKITYSSE